MRGLLISNLGHVAATLTGVAMVVALLHLTERWAGCQVARRVGWRGVLLTGWIGVPVHELAHLFVAKLFGHRIIAWKLFDPDPATGTLGYVRHAHARRSLFQIQGNFLIGVAPLVVGGGLLGLLAWWMLPAASVSSLGTQMREVAFEAGHTGVVSQELWRRLLGYALGHASAMWHHRTGWMPLQLYLCLCIACHVAPSRPDLRASWSGGVAFLVLLLSLVLVASLAGMSLAGGLIVLLPCVLLLGCVAVLSGTLVLGVVTLTRMNRSLRRHRPPRG